jgi:hypothetical protein
MSPSTISIDPRATAASERKAEVYPSASSSGGEKNFQGARLVPMSVPEGQGYLWSIAWQKGEAEADEALMTGDFVKFDSDDPDDVIRWLLLAEDE